MNGETELAVLEGFTIRNGRTFEPGSGAGIFCDGASPTIVGCIFSGNRAAGGHGGAIYCANSSLAVRNCTFMENEALNFGGAIIALDSSPIVRDCEFSGNFAVWGGAILLGGSSATIERCVYSANIAVRGAAIYLSSGTLSMANSTLAGNRSGLYMTNSSSATVSKTIITSSTQGPAAVCAIGSTAILDCSDVIGNVGGDWVECLVGQGAKRGNFAANPLFCDAPGGRFSLAENSPCLPGNHPQGGDCGLIGAVGLGCPPAAVHGTTWGGIKARYK